MHFTQNICFVFFQRTSDSQINVKLFFFILQLFQISFLINCLCFRRIFPAENIAVSFVTIGEGYHNYHHTFPWDYRTSELGKRMNLTTFLLNIFKQLGWAYDLKTPSLELVKKMIQNHGDGSHHKWGREVPIEENCGLNEKTKKMQLFGDVS